MRSNCDFSRTRQVTTTSEPAKMSDAARAAFVAELLRIAEKITERIAKSETRPVDVRALIG